MMTNHQTDWDCNLRKSDLRSKEYGGLDKYGCLDKYSCLDKYGGLNKYSGWDRGVCATKVSSGGGVI